MKVILINPNNSLISKSWGYRKFFTPVAPLGLAYIASVLEKEGISVSIVDQFARKMSNKELVRLIEKEKPQVVGLAALTPVMPDIKEIIKHIKIVSSDSVVVLGNIHASCFPEELLKGEDVDIVVRGDGEMTMLDICNCLKNGTSLEGVKGISFKTGGKIIHNPDREPLKDLDSLPLPAWHLVNLDDYNSVPLAAINGCRTLPIMASRGCVFRCYYCSQDKIDKAVRYRNLNRVVDEMEYFNTKFNIKFFGFNDAYFPFDEESGLHFCDLIKQKGLHKRIRWCVETRVDKVTPRLLRVMAKSGVHLIMYGIEVGNESILKFINKGTTLEQARIAIRETRKAGILSLGLFMLGLPGETVKTCKDTISFAKELNCDIAKFNIAVPYPGSRFFDDFGKIDILNDPGRVSSWIDWTSCKGKLIHVPEKMTSESLSYLQRRAMLEFYIRPRMILNSIEKKTITYKNIYYGALWLVLLFSGGILNRLKSLTRIKK